MPIVLKENSPFFYYDFRFGGKRYRGSTKETTKAAARAFEAELIHKLRSGDRPAAGSRVPTVLELLDKFEAFFENHQQRKIKTKIYYKTGKRLLLQTTLKDVPIDKLTTSRISCIAFPGSPSNGNCALRTLRRVLAQGVEWGYIRSIPRIHMFAELGRETIFTPEYERDLLKVATQPLRDVFIVLMDTGMRPEEVCRMRWEDVIWDRSSIHVKKGKTRAARRFIGMSERVQAVLRLRATDQGTSKDKRIASSPWVFPSTAKSGRIAKEGHIVSVSKAFRLARKLADLPESLVLYSARHTFGTDVMMGTGNQKLVATVMGQSDIKTSARYQHPTTEGVRDIINQRNRRRLEDGQTFGQSGKDFSVQ